MFSQLDGSKDSFPLDEIFSAFIEIGFNKGYLKELFIENYPSLLLVGFGLIYRISCLL